MKLPELPVALSYGDVLLAPQHSTINSRSEVDLTTKITKNITLKIPLFSINMDCVTGVEMAVALGKAGGMGFLPRFDAPEIQAEKVAAVKKEGVLVGAALGIKNGYMARAELLAKAGADILTIDIAHGHMQKCLDATNELKLRFGDKIAIISGVVGTYEGAKALFEAGADSVRVGVGPGTICTTRVQTGHGVPQISALLMCAKAARETGKTLLADGGTENSGDIVKGLAAGGSAIICGSLLAGTDEAPGEICEIDGKKFKEYNASTSQKEKMKQIEKFGEDKDAQYAIHVEGVEGYAPYKGPVSGVVEKLMAGVRSGLSYSGARNIEELWEKAVFMRVTPNGVHENGYHGIVAKH